MNEKSNTKRYRYIMKIPNDDIGMKILNDFKYYANTNRYRIRLKGSKLNDDRIREHLLSQQQYKYLPLIDLNNKIREIKRYRNDSGSMLLGYCDYIRVYLDDKCE